MLMAAIPDCQMVRPLEVWIETKLLTKLSKERTVNQEPEILSASKPF